MAPDGFFEANVTPQDRSVSIAFERSSVRVTSVAFGNFVRSAARPPALPSSPTRSASALPDGVRKERVSTMNLLSRWIGPLLGTIGLTLLLVSSAGAQSVDQEISTYRQKLADARSERLDLIAPKAFATAEKEMAQAVQRFERGGRIEDIQKRLTKVQEWLTYFLVSPRKFRARRYK